MKYIFQSDNIGIRKMEDEITDYKHMTKWLSTEELLDYYAGRSNSFSLEKVIKKYSPRVKGEDVVVPCLIEFSQKPIGYIQYYPIKPDVYNVNGVINMEDYMFPYGIDLFIGETDNWNKGIGTIVLRGLISYLFKDKNADIILIDPQTWNKRAIRCYEKSGFIPRGVVKNRELHDGEYKDSLIMSISFEEWNTNNYKIDFYTL